MGHFQAKPASWKSLFSLKNDPRWTTNDLHMPKTISFIFSSCSGIQNTCLCEVCSHLLNNCSRYYIFSRLLRFLLLKFSPFWRGWHRPLKTQCWTNQGISGLQLPWRNQQLWIFEESLKSQKWRAISFTTILGKFK